MSRSEPPRLPTSRPAARPRRRAFLPVLALAAALPLALALPREARADDWPQWRGPQRDGRSVETGLLERWPEGGPPLLWSSPGFGTGFSSLAVAGERIFTLGDLTDGQYVIAAREGDGAIQWKTKVGPVWEDEYPGPRSTPTIAGDRLYALGTEGDLVCLKTADGSEVWRRNLRRDFASRQMAYEGNYSWKYSESPLVDGDRVIVTPGVRDALMVALDAATGEEVWRTRVDGGLGERGDDGAAYASAVVSTADGVRQYVQLIGRGAVGVDAATGKLLWTYNRVANDVANIPTPLVAGDRVFVSTGYQTGAALLEIAKGENGVTAKERYFLEGETFQNHHGNMILDDGTVYAGHGHNRGFPLALDLASGEVRWGPVRNEGTGSAAVAWADDRLYFRYQNGLMVLIESTPEGYRELGSFMIPDVKRQSWSHPVIANGKLLLREQDAIHAYDLRRGESGARGGGRD